MIRKKLSNQKSINLKISDSAHSFYHVLRFLDLTLSHTSRPLFDSTSSHLVEERLTWEAENLVPVRALSLAGCVTLDKSLNLFFLQSSIGKGIVPVNLNAGTVLILHSKICLRKDQSDHMCPDQILNSIFLCSSVIILHFLPLQLSREEGVCPKKCILWPTQCT